MRDKILSIIMIPAILAAMLISVYVSSANVYADEFHALRIVDMADLLTDAEEAELAAKLDTISDRQQFDIVVVTTNTLEGKTPQEYADDYYDFNGYGYGPDKDGCLLLVSMEDRDYHITTTGYGITALTDYGLDVIEGYFVPKLSAGNFKGAFDTFADTVDSFVTEAKNGNPVDVPQQGQQNNIPFANEAKEMPGAGAAAGAAGAGLVTSALATGSMRKKLRTVKKQAAASYYYDRSTMRINVSRDDYMYRNVTRTPIPQHRDHDGGGSSTHFGSSGIMHGGSGGKF